MNRNLSLFDQMMVAITFAEAGEPDWAQDELSKNWKPKHEQQAKVEKMAGRKIMPTPVTH